MSDLRYSWAIAVWNLNFTQFLHDYLREKKITAAQNLELSAGQAIRAAIQAGLRVESLVLNEEPYLDSGTPDDLHKAIKRTV